MYFKELGGKHNEKKYTFKEHKCDTYLKGLEGKLKHKLIALNDIRKLLYCTKSTKKLIQKLIVQKKE